MVLNELNLLNKNFYISSTNTSYIFIEITVNIQLQVLQFAILFAISVTLSLSLKEKEIARRGSLKPPSLCFCILDQINCSKPSRNDIFGYFLLLLTAILVIEGDSRFAHKVTFRNNRISSKSNNKEQWKLNT